MGYLIVAISLAITGYIVLYRPSILLLEEILEKPTPYGGLMGIILFLIIGFICAPVLLIILLKNDNDKFIYDLATRFYEAETDEE